MASSFTAKDLRGIVDNLNELLPLTQPNGYGTTDRFLLNRAYGGYQVTMVNAGCTGQREVTTGHHTPMHTAANLCEWIVENMPRLIYGNI